MQVDKDFTDRTAEMQIITSIQALTDALSWRRQNKSLGLVITKGNVHAGHRALIAACVNGNDLSVVISYAGAQLFYDQQEAQTHARIDTGECALLEELGVDVLFAPKESELYPRGHSGLARIDLPPLDGRALTGADLTHCQEQVTLIIKLWNLVGANRLIFGEAHLLHLHLIEQTLADLNLPTAVQRIPVVRDSDGLVVSSRNAALSATERANASLLYQTLKDIAHAISNGARHFDKLEQTARIALRGGGFKTDYVAICDANTLQPPDQAADEFRILGAARLGNVRLIDHIYVRT